MKRNDYFSLVYIVYTALRYIYSDLFFCCGGIDKVKDLLDTEVAIVEGSAKGDGTNDGSASPDAYNGSRADEVIPDP